VFLPIEEIGRGKFVLSEKSLYEQLEILMSQWLTQNVELDDSKYQLYIQNRKGCCISEKILNHELSGDQNIFQRTDDSSIYLNREDQIIDETDINQRIHGVYDVHFRKFWL
jgi:hypothetical protein